ncbi:UDP-N-acetylglucosamine 2-epimerase [Roseibium sp. SCPC15]|uniref:UDP-N-acetylglucosamine 2-epimerase n=1 Tax=Roseibium sp. SCP15 TaxID=3141376 RepID=UPI00333C3C68
MSIARCVPHVLFVTGTRADFSKIKGTAESLIREGWKVTFFVTGMHMLETYGATFLEVRKIAGAEQYEYVNQREGDPLDLVFSKTVLGFSDWIHEHCPDLVIVHGDRVEAKACAFVCATNYIRCVHIEGGEVSGTIDEVFRHCVTKLAHHHFVCSETAARNVVSLGEDPNRVVLMGSPELDTHAAEMSVKLDEVRRYYEIPFEEYGIVVFHPVTSEVQTIGQQAQDLFNSLAQSGRDFVVIASNNDPGAKSIMDVVEQQDLTRFRTLPSMRFEYFSILFRNASLMVGNSSAGVREAPFLGVPSINVGSRQTGRSSAASVFNVEAREHDEITRYIDKQWNKRFERCTEFGDGNSVVRFVNELKKREFWEIPMQKHFFRSDGENIKMQR